MDRHRGYAGHMQSVILCPWCVTVLQHQQQVLGAIERAKQVTPPEMNSIIRVRMEENGGSVSIYSCSL